MKLVIIKDRQVHITQMTLRRSLGQEIKVSQRLHTVWVISLMLDRWTLILKINKRYSVVLKQNFQCCFILPEFTFRHKVRDLSRK